MEKRPVSQASEYSTSEKSEIDDTPTTKQPAVLGSSELFNENGLRFIPMPTPDPKDPLNMPNWQKWTAIIVLCLFGSLGLAAEVVIGGLIPVFVLEYSGIDPVSVLSDPATAARVAGGDPLSILPPGVSPKVTLVQVALLATVPQIANGISGYLLIPLSVAIGRRPVLIVTAIAAWAGGFWAGASTTLNSHIAARVLHGLGAGSVEALLPLIVQDMVFIHQRARATAAVIASQGLFIVILGLLGPYLSAHYTWRWIYWITSVLGVIMWVLIMVLVPETKWKRSEDELSGVAVYPLAPGENRPRPDAAKYGPRTRWTDYGLFQNGVHWRDALVGVVEPLRVSFYPSVLFMVVLNTMFLMISSATAQTITFALLAAGIPFEWTGISSVPSIVGTVLIYFLGGTVADKLALKITRLNGGKREPEHLLPNMTISIVMGIAGCFMFGVAAQRNLSPALLLFGNFMLLFGSLTLLTTSNVFLIESFPQKANSVIVSASSLKIISSFFLTTQATTWLAQLGALRLFAIFAELLIVVSLGIPVLYFFGKRMRMWTSGVKVQ